MTGYFQRAKKTVTYRVLSAFVAFTFSFSYIIPPSSLYAQGIPATFMNLPVPGTPVPLTPGFTPARIIGMTIHADNPLMFDFMVDPGDMKLNDQQMQDESLKLVKYFLASLTVPAEKLWVNLSPYEKDKIVPKEFGQTEMGAELLAQDYMLKQLTASLMNPEDELGKKFWDRVYAKTQKMFGTTEIPLNTFNKVWIVPEKAVVYANGLNVFVLESRFKVMMEEDYLALQHHSAESPNAKSDVISGVSSSVIKEVLLPEIEKEVNEGKTFANLRQIHNSLILATWYKQNLKESLLGKIYTDKGKTGGLTVGDKETSQKIYDQYVEAFQKGVYNFIKEDYDPATKQIIPRKYFSGGVTEASLRVEGRTSPEPGVLQAFAKDLPNVSIVTAGAESLDKKVTFEMPFVKIAPPAEPASSPVLSEETQAQLRETAAKMVPLTGGILAADESTGSAKARLDLVGLENTPENREKMRQLMLTTPGLAAAGINAVILYSETFDNTDGRGGNLTEYLLSQGILPGIKTDGGLIDDPESAGEKIPDPKGLAKLPEMLTKFKAKGAVFTKWRTTQAIDKDRGLPTKVNIRKNAAVQAQQARMTQEAGLVPIVEPEVLLDGTHDIAASYKATTQTLEITFEELAREGVWLPGMILKTSMILSGNKAENRADSETVGYQTLKGLLKVVPAEVPAIVFLSGGQKDDEVVKNLDAVIRASQTQFEAARNEAAVELRAEGKAEQAQKVQSLAKDPWEISYSFGRGLQRPALLAWAGKDENFAAAQDVMKKTSLSTQAARLGRLASSPILGLSVQENQRLQIALRRFPNLVATRTAEKLTQLGLRGAYKHVVDIGDREISNEQKLQDLKYLFADLYQRTEAQAIEDLEIMVTQKQANDAIAKEESARIRQVIKDTSDGFAKRVFVETAKEEGLIMMVRVSEGFGRDEVAESLKANEVVVPDDLRGEIDRVIIAIQDGEKIYRSTSSKVYGIVNAIIDVIEGTDMFVTNSDDKMLAEIEDFESGSTSVIVTGDGVADLGNSPDGYVGQFLTNLGEHAEAFKQRTVEVNGQMYSLRDPELYMAHPEKLEEYLKFLAQIRGQRLEDVQEEIVLMDRPRETDMIQAIQKLQQRIPGLKIAGKDQKGIKDGTVAHGLKAVMTPQMFETLTGKAYGPHKTVLTTGGAAEGFMNLAIAGGFETQGAVGGVRVFSGQMNKDEQGVEMKDKSQRYNFRVDPRKPEGNELANIRNLRKQYGDAEEILTGKKVFVEDNVKGAVTGAFSFISTNGVFFQKGVAPSDHGDGANINVLRIETQPGQKPVLAIVSNRILPNGVASLHVLASDLASSPIEHPPVYYFGIYDPSINSELPRGDIKMKSLLGGKGAGLADMANQLSLRADSYEAWLRDEKGLSPERIVKYKLRVPLGYTITTEQTRHWKERRDQGEEGISPELRQVMTEAMARLETASGKKLGGTEGMPLLVAVRSGAKESMPGMMDTVLNLGMNDRSVEALANASSEKFAWDTYRRFVEMYGSIVLGVENDEVKHTGFAAILEHMIKERGVADEYGLGTQDYKKLVGLYKAEIQKQGKEPIPDDPYQQYFKAVETVMRSTFNERAMVYRASQKLKLEDTLSAVNVVEMIYGNRNSKSGTGVAFTRDTATGEKKFNLEFAFEAQGEDVVKGRKKGMFFEDLQTQAPDVAENIRLIGQFLEKTYTDIQDMEFTFEHDENSNTTNVYMLQTRNAKRTSQAEVRAAVEMADEGLISQEMAVKRVNAEKLGELLASRFNPEEKRKAFATRALLSDGGLNASPGAGVGIIALDADKAKAEDQRIKAIQERIKRGESVSDREKILAEVGGVVLVREETSPDDLGGMVVSKAIATSRGGRTSHAAVVARQFGIPAVVGDKNMVIDFANRTATFTRADGSHETLKEGDIISIDGSGDKGKGQVFKGKIGTKPSMIITAQNIESLDKARDVITLLQGWIDNLTGPNVEIFKLEYTQHIRDYVNYVNEYKDKQLTAEEEAFFQQYKKLLGWASQLRKDKKGLGVGANAERPLDVLNAVVNGAERFGLVRTEHMFSGAGRELKFQRMILAESPEARQAALNQLLPQQQADFEQIFLFADGRPVTIRLIDPPLHEFLPKEPAKIRELADSLGISVADVQQKIDALKEENPMFGTRGVRLSILFPEIIEMQVDAIFNAMKKVQTARIAVNPEIMVPLVGNVREFNFVKSRIENIARRQRVHRGDFKIGTMIEIVAAGMNAAEIAKEAEFLSFGTNDYTQGGLKISRDDGKEYLENAKQAGVFTDDPFVTIDSGVALFIKRTVEAARAVKRDIKIGICGEQGVDPTSISRYLAPYGLNYVSGGSLRLPGALLATAQEALKGHAPLEGKIRKETPVQQKRLYERVPRIADAQTFDDQLRAAAVYVEANDNTVEARMTALANLDLTKEMDAELKKSPDFIKVYSWAYDLLGDNNLEKMGVKVKVGADVNLDQELIPYNGLGMMTTEEYFMGDDNPIRHFIQAYLLAKDGAKKSEFLSEIKEAVQRTFLENSGDETLTRRTFIVSLPNIALQDVFHYENEAAFHAAMSRLSQQLAISEEEVRERIAKYHESNSAMGQRGSRVFFTEAAPLYTTIIAAIAQAAVKKDYSTLNFILPFTVNRKEIEVVRSGYADNRGKVVVPSIDQILKEGREIIEINIGAEIETPAAAATAADIAKAVDGGPVIIDSKRLTEAVWAAFENDVRGAFLKTYMREGIWEEDPYKITPADTRLLIQEAIGAIRAKAWNQEINLVVNPNDVKLIAMAQQAGVSNLIVERDDAQLATIAAAQVAITIPVLAENGALKAETRKPASSSPVTSNEGPVEKGGIDLNPGNMDLQSNYGGERIQLPMPNIPLESIKIDGLVPIIIHVAPVVNLPFLLGLSDVPVTDDAAEFQPQQSPIDAPRRFKAREAEEIGLLN